MNFEQLIISVLSRSNLKHDAMKIFTREIYLFKTAFTAPSHDEFDNYEVLEQLGDATFTNFLVTYFYSRFPQLDCPNGVKVVARLKINYSSKQTFAQIAEKLGFWPFIQASKTDKDTHKKSLLEDTLEAFIGATVKIIDSRVKNVGVGYVIAYRILKSIFDEMPIPLSYEDLFDPKSRLKEYFDKNKNLGVLKYTHNSTTKTTKLYAVVGTTEHLLQTAVGNLKGIAEQTAAQKAIISLNIQKPIGYNLCE